MTTRTDYSRMAVLQRFTIAGDGDPVLGAIRQYDDAAKIPAYAFDLLHSIALETNDGTLPLSRTAATEARKLIDDGKRNKGGRLTAILGMLLSTPSAKHCSAKGPERRVSSPSLALA